jgi:hypothetical protein
MEIAESFQKRLCMRALISETVVFSPRQMLAGAHCVPCR